MSNLLRPAHQSFELVQGTTEHIQSSPSRKGVLAIPTDYPAGGGSPLYVGLEDGGSYVPLTPWLVAATPSMTASQTFSVSVSVTLACTTVGAVIHYTDDGTTPTAASPVYSGAITVSETTAIKAISVAPACATSAVASATYTQQAATPTVTPASQTFNVSVSVTLACATVGAAIHYTDDGATPTAASPVYSGAITVDKTTVIKAVAIASGFANSAVASATYTQRAATPTITPASQTFSDPDSVSVTLACATVGAAIHYTDDGATPTAASPVYSEAITVAGETTVIKAVAIATGYATSAVATATYTLV